MSEKRPRNTTPAGEKLAYEIVQSTEPSAHPECGPEERDALANEILNSGGEGVSKVCPPEEVEKTQQNDEEAFAKIVGGSSRHKPNEQNGTNAD